MAKSISPPERWPSGEKKRPRRLEQIAEAERAVAEANMQVVLAQPHRRGNRSQLSESPLGRFCLTHGLDRALYDAGESYGAMRRKWCAQIGAPMPDRMNGNSANEVTIQDWKKWEKTILDWESEMRRAAGARGLDCVVSLIFDRPEPSIKIHAPVTIAALNALAKHQGRK